MNEMFRNILVKSVLAAINVARVPNLFFTLLNLSLADIFL